MYSLLAGFVEPGESIETAVQREVFEESRIAVGTVRFVASQPRPLLMSLMFGCNGEALSAAITIDPVELAAANWVTGDEVFAILADTHGDIARARAGAIEQAPIEAQANGHLFDASYWTGKVVAGSDDGKSCDDDILSGNGGMSVGSVGAGENIRQLRAEGRRRPN
ncbi:MAG: pyrophosphatase [Devosia sp.]|nr:pyrophosphatase [Devosia sp.]